MIVREEINILGDIQYRNYSDKYVYIRNVETGVLYDVVNSSIDYTYEETDIEIEDAKLFQKYSTFYATYAQVIAEVIAINPNIPPDITYSNLVKVLMMLDGDMWTKKALILNLLWQDVVVESGLTAGGAFDLVPVLESRRKA
jgi:hypothetical protein